MADKGTDRPERLTGGVNEILRVGNTVIRPAGPHSATVHRYLGQLRQHGFERAPEPLALDSSAGTETLSFLPGLVSGYPLDPAFCTDRALIGAARLLRELHLAGARYRPAADDRWDLPTRQPVEVICHGDFAPYNCVVNDGEVTGVFDFDTAHPGPKLWDVGYGAYRWVPLTAPSNPDGSPAIDEQRRRLGLFCAQYGVDRITAVVDWAAERLTALVAMMVQRAADGHPAFARHLAEGHDQLYLADIEHLRSNRLVLAGAG